jgi:hypothetical protein
MPKIKRSEGWPLLQHQSQAMQISSGCTSYTVAAFFHSQPVSGFCRVAPFEEWGAESHP